MASFLGRAGSSQDPRLPAARILVVGNAGSGKTSVAHLLATSEPSKQAVRPTVGCSTHVALVDAPLLGEAFVELWDVGAHERYRGLRSSFYADISGVIIVYDSTSARKHASVRKWAAEVAAKGRFAAALPPEQAAANPGGLPVPCLVIANKADLRSARGLRAGWARRGLAWLDVLTRQFKFRRRLAGLLRPASSSRLPDSAAALNVVSASAKQGTIDSAAVASFFQECLALRLGAGGAGGGSAAKAGRRSAADSQLLRKPPLPSSGPPPPSLAASLAEGVGGGPHSAASSWGGFSSGGFISRTASWHSTLSSAGAPSEHAGGWEARRGADAAPDDSEDLV